MCLRALLSAQGSFGCASVPPSCLIPTEGGKKGRVLPKPLVLRARRAALLKSTPGGPKGDAPSCAGLC